MNKWKEIEEALKNNPWSQDDVLRHELIEKISIYHEELHFQNEELKRVNKYLESLKDDYKDLFNFAPITFFIIDKQSVIIEANQNAKMLFGDIINKSLKDYVAPKEKNSFYVFLKSLFDKNTNRTHITFMTKDSRLKMEIIGKNVNSKQDHFLIACIDFEEQYKMLQKYNAYSYTDYLTGLFNRRYFEEKINQINTHMMPVSFIMSDVNGLKMLNDSLGHQKGDELLKKFAEIISSIDVKDSVICRTGGDEFAIILPNTNAIECQKIIDDIYVNCDSLKIDDILFSVSFGHATMNVITEDADSLIAKAEKEMYTYKAANERKRGIVIIESMLKMFWNKFPKEKIHSERVSKYMEQLGVAFDCDEDTIQIMKYAGLYHNIGKIATCDQGIDKRLTLSLSDYEDMKKHPEISYRILKSNSKFSKIANVVLYHQEWVDGSGYPKGLTGKELSFEAKALSVCVAFDTMISDNIYNLAMTFDDALANIEEKAGRQFDKDIVKVFVNMVRNEDKILYSK